MLISLIMRFDSYWRRLNGGVSSFSLNLEGGGDASGPPGLGAKRCRSWRSALPIRNLVAEASLDVFADLARFTCLSSNNP